jgi:malate dehydrogenase (quinone)
MQKIVNEIDIALIGGGIMSATLATILHEIDPKLKIHLFEKLPSFGEESSAALNNAGTGHAGNCELNYTPEKNNKINLNKALSVCEMFELSLQLWAYIVKNDKSIAPETFITKSPHASFVWDKRHTEFLEKRFNLISKQPLFKGMTFTKDAQTIKSLFPLLIKGRKNDENISLTNYEYGTDVNFGQLTSILIKRLLKNPSFKIHTNEHVTKIKKMNNGYQFQTQFGQVHTNFIFLGAGGNSIKILQNLKLPQAKGYGGFPISGKWLVCDNQTIIKQHKGKVYSQAETGAPPMSVPHLDIRNINGKQSLLFGPFAGFTFKFLKSGSFLDFPSSIKLSNLKEILTVGIKNLNLVSYLVKQALQNHSNRMKHLRKFYPEAKSSDWKLISAGQRVQIIKPSDGLFGKLEFGTEIIYDNNKTLAALLGASPGASVSAASMLEIVEKCFLNKNQEYRKKLRTIFPSYGIKLNDNPSKLQKLRSSYRKILKLL